MRNKFIFVISFINKSTRNKFIRSICLNKLLNKRAQFFLFIKQMLYHSILFSHGKVNNPQVHSDKTVEDLHFEKWLGQIDSRFEF